MLRAALIVWLALALPAYALTPAQKAIGGHASSYVGPGDVIPAATIWYSCARAYRRAYATAGGLACNLRNTSTNETCDERLTPAGAPGTMTNCSAGSNGKTLAAFCACAVAKMYDQTGNGHVATQATAANQPTLTVSCLNGLPCISMTTNTMSIKSTANFVTPATGVMSLIFVADRSAGTGASLFQETTNNNIRSATALANNWTLTASVSGGFNASATDATWHVGVGIINGASSALVIDGTATTGTATGGTVSAAAGFTGASATTMLAVEGGAWDNQALTTAQRTALCKNAQAAYGGGSNFGATC